MQTLEYRHREEDRQKWGPGPWDNEPDKRQWLDDATGLPCLIVRGPFGQWCGYVGVPEGHPYFQQKGEKVPVRVHGGGLTFSGFCAPDDKEHGICHVVDPGENDRVWWLGFDCGHYMDLIPELMKAELRGDSGPPQVYRNEDYVSNEVLDLALQLAKAA